MVATLGGALVVVAPPSPAFACVCSSRMGLAEADIVFVGVPMEVDYGSRDGGGSTLRFAVSAVVKGDLSRWVDVQVTGVLGDCGWDYELGERYLIYAATVDGVYRHNPCSLTRLLREGSPMPADAYSPRRPRAIEASDDGWLGWATAVAMLMLVPAALLALRARRRQKSA